MFSIGERLKVKGFDFEEIKGRTVTGKIQYDATPLQKIKREISRKASMANKRLERLERNNLTNLPAYKQWVDGGKVRFSVAGKTYNELQSELARVNRFIDSKTSLVRGANQYLKEIAEMTGISYNSVKDLPKKTERFFELASKAEQYLRNVEGSASAIGYHKIWDIINEYVEDENLALEDSRIDLDSILDEIIELSKYDIKDGYVNVDFEGWINV